MRYVNRTSPWLRPLLALFAGWLIVAAGYQAHAQQARLTLSEAITQAVACGPAFRDLARMQEHQRLVKLGEQSANRPAWQVTAGANVRPTAGATADPNLSVGAAATMNWQLTDTLRLRLNVPLGASITAPPVSTSTGQSVSLDWTQQLLPTGDHDVTAGLALVQQHIADLEYSEQVFSALLEVITSFHQLRATVTRVDLAQLALQLAQGKADDVLQRYENGLIGLGALQDEQRAHHQALAALQRAERDQQQASQRFEQIVGSGSCGLGDDNLDLVDDLDWASWVAIVAGQAEQAGHTLDPASNQHSTPEDWADALLSHSLAYQRAIVAELQAQAALAKVEGERIPAATAGANISSNLTAATPDWSVGVNARWDLGPNRTIDHQRALLDLAAAQDHLAIARSTALQSGSAAQLAIADAADALKLADQAYDQAVQTEHVVMRRVMAGFAPAPELEQAQLEVKRRALDVQQAELEVWQAWLRLGQRLGIATIGHNVQGSK